MYYTAWYFYAFIILTCFCYKSWKARHVFIVSYPLSLSLSLFGHQVTLASFATYVLLGNNLDATTAFTSLSLFNILRFPISMMPMMVSYMVTVSGCDTMATYTPQSLSRYIYNLCYIYLRSADKKRKFAAPKLRFPPIASWGFGMRFANIGIKNDSLLIF